MAKRNKVFFGFKKVHIAFMTDETAGAPVYATPIAVPGAVTFSPSAETEDYEFYADDVAYFTDSQNNGYTGDLEMAKFPDEIVSEMLGWVIDANGALLESPNGEVKKFALMAEISGDVKGRRVVFYCCTGSAPNTSYSTTETTKEVATQTMSVTVIPFDLGIDLGDGDTTRTMATLEYDSEDHTAYDKWFEAVYMPVASTTTTE